MVVGFTILFENGAKMVFGQDQDRVKTLFANQAHLLFSESFRSAPILSNGALALFAAILMALGCRKSG